MVVPSTIVICSQVQLFDLAQIPSTAGEIFVSWLTSQVQLFVPKYIYLFPSTLFHPKYSQGSILLRWLPKYSQGSILLSWFPKYSCKAPSTDTMNVCSDFPWKYVENMNVLSNAVHDCILIPILVSQVLFSSSPPKLWSRECNENTEPWSAH